MKALDVAPACRNIILAPSDAWPEAETIPMAVARRHRITSFGRRGGGILLVADPIWYYYTYVVSASISVLAW